MSLPLDSDCSNPLNLKTEIKRLSDAPNIHRTIIPTYAPFFKSDLIITDINDNRLLEGSDYYLGHYYEAASKETHRPIYGSVILNSTTIDEVKFKRYHSLGGNAIVPKSLVSKYLADPEMVSPRSTDWYDVLKRDVVIITLDPPESIDEAISSDGVTEALDYVVKTITSSGNNKNSEIGSLVSRLEKVYADYIAMGYQTHISSTGTTTHQLSSELVGAANRADIAPDALYLNGVDKDTVVSWIREAIFGVEELSTLANRDDLELLGVLSIAINTSIIVSSGLTFNVEDGLIAITNGKSNFIIKVTSEDGTESNFRLRSGRNKIELGTKRQPLYRDGKPILGVENASEYLNPTLGGASNLNTRNTDSVKLLGNGTESSKLSATVEPVTAAIGRVGTFNVADDGSTNNVASSGYLFDILERSNFLVRKGFKINGKELYDGLQLVAEDFGLSSVNNTAPKDKAINLTLVEALSKVVYSNHTHKLTDIKSTVDATRDKRGLSQFSRGGLGAYNDVLRSHMDLSQSRTIAEKFIDKASLSGYYLENLVITEAIDDSTKDHILTISDFKQHIGYVTNEIIGLVLVNFTGNVGILDGVLNTDGLGEIICKRSNGIVYSLPRYRRNMTRAWLEHKYDPNAHSKAVEQGYYSIIKNLPLKEVWTDPMDLFLKDWVTMSHSIETYDQPAKPTELDIWESIYPRIESKSTTLGCSLIRSPLIKSYEVETLVTFNSLTTDTHGSAVILLGSWQNEKECTLSLVISNVYDYSSGLTKVVTLWRDYNQPSAVLMEVLKSTTDTLEELSNYYAHCIYSYSEGVLNYKIAFEDYDATNLNLINELPFMDLDYISRSTDVSDMFVGDMLSHGVGSHNYNGVNFNFVKCRDISTMDTYASQGYLREASQDQTPELKGEKYTLMVDMAPVEKGVWESEEAIELGYSLSSLVDKPHTIEQNIVDGKATIRLKMIYTDSDGNSLYEPPTERLVLTFSKVELS